jgi:two-component system CheB/CheR fusion protein
MISANLRARKLFALTAADVGRPIQDLEISYRPADLRSAIERAYKDGNAVELGWIPWTVPDDGQVTLDIRVTPVAGNGTDFLGAIVGFADVTDLARLDSEYESSRRQLETAYEELQSTVEELETTNEELHSTNEELETTNEELQSANEELETTNEELQSANDELEAMNDEHTRRAGELDRVNMFLEGILSNLGVGVIVVDGEANVELWNASSVDLWGLRHDEVEGQDLFSLEFGFPIEELRAPIRDAVGQAPDGADGVVPAMTRRGRRFECWYRVLPLKKLDGSPYGAIVLMADNAVASALAPVP